MCVCRHVVTSPAMTRNEIIVRKFMIRIEGVIVVSGNYVTLLYYK